ncbi:MAG: DMT family transporter [Alphaproteobacteria bacterium]|nr:DMT family transporter [Alphaproteobacteria bacterium]MDE2336092.1 DMT family transporter [Alphaproteobacteria bacterium]
MLSPQTPWGYPSMLAVVLWGVSAFLPKLALRQLPPLHMTVYSNCFFLLGCVALQAFYGFHVEFNARGVMLAGLVGVSGGTAQLFYNLSLRNNSLTYNVVIASLYPVVATLMAYLFLGETLGARQAAGVALGIVSLLMMVKTSDRKTEGP